jgi:hypothetical protein
MIQQLRKNEIQNAMDGWLATAKKLKQTQDVWEAQQILKKLLDSLQMSGYKLAKIVRDRKEFDTNERMN